LTGRAKVTKRILHIVPSLEPRGTTKQVNLLVKGLPRDEFELRIVSLNCTSPVACGLQQDGIKPISIRRRGQVDPRAFWKLRQLIRRLRPDIVHTWTFAANTYGRLAAIAAGGARIVASERHLDAWKSGLELAVDRRLAWRSDCIVVNSAAVRDFYVARGLPSAKIHLIPSGVLPAEPKSVDRRQLLDEIRLPHDAKLIAYLGPLTLEKRLKELIWATDQLKAVGVPAHLLMIGDGPRRQPLERYRRLNRVDDRVHFLGWRTDVPRLLSQVDVVWHAGAQDGQSSAILEAMAAGIPVVAADAPGNRELVAHGVNGYLVPLKERAGFARWTLPLLEDAALANRIGEAGRQRVLEGHRLEDMLSAYANVYRSL
jgi:glycosyltransferase involved in cell wall biosynthesis